MKKTMTGLLLTLCMFVMPMAVEAAATDSYVVSTDTELTTDATYGSLRITDATLTIKEGVTLTIDGSENLTDNGNYDLESSVVLLTNGNIIMEKGSTLIITNSHIDTYSALTGKGDSNITLTEATLQVNNNDTYGIDGDHGLKITLIDSTLEANENTYDGIYYLSDGIYATDSYITATKNGEYGILAKLVIDGNTTVDVSENNYTGIILYDGSQISDHAYIMSTNNNLEESTEDADLMLDGTLTINESGGIYISTAAPFKDYYGDKSVNKDAKIVINGSQAVAMVGAYLEFCDGAENNEECDSANLYSINNDLQNGVLITLDENQKLTAVIGGTIDTSEVLEIPSEIERVIINDTVTKDVSINVAENTVIENNSTFKVNVAFGEESIVVEAGKDAVAKATAGTTTNTNDKKEELPPNTGDINLYIIISVILMAIGLTGFVGKKIYAKVK